MEWALDVAGEANKPEAEASGRARKSPVVRAVDIECGGVGSGGVRGPVAGPGAVLVGRTPIGGAASLSCPGTSGDCCGSGASAANDRGLPLGGGGRDIGRADKVKRRCDRAVPTVLCGRGRSNIGMGIGGRKDKKKDVLDKGNKREEAANESDICRGCLGCWLNRKTLIDQVSKKNKKFNWPRKKKELFTPWYQRQAKIVTCIYNKTHNYI